MAGVVPAGIGAATRGAAASVGAVRAAGIIGVSVRARVPVPRMSVRVVPVPAMSVRVLARPARRCVLAAVPVAAVVVVPAAVVVAVAVAAADALGADADAPPRKVSQEAIGIDL